MNKGINVKSATGEDLKPLLLEKMHRMVDEACNDLAGVSASQVEMQSGIQFYDGITTAEIQEILIRSASDLIDLDHPNYQFVAARLLLFSIRKQLYGRRHETPNLKDHVASCVEKGVYDPELLNLYSDEEFEKLQSFIDHGRDYLFTYAGLRQVVDKYLVQDRSSGVLYETPQFMYILIAATIFSKYPKDTRLDYVKKYYDAISKHKLNIPTPIMAELEHHFGSMQAAFWLTLMTPSIVSLLAIWLLANMSLSVQESASTQAESVASTVRSGAAKFNTQVLFLFLKSLNQLSGVVHKMEYEVGQRLSTSQSGTKKSKTSLS